MPFDPISVLAIVGTIFSVLSTVSSTIENIANKTTQYYECFITLKRYEKILGSIFLALESWQALWSRDTFGRRSFYGTEACTLLWGKRGFQDIVERTELILQNSALIIDLLRCSNARSARFDRKSMEQTSLCPTDQELAQWNHAVDRIQEKRRKDSIQADWLYKIRFAIYKNSELKSRISDLKADVDDLEKTSMRLYQMQHPARLGSTPAAREIQERVVFNEDRQKLVTFSNELFEENAVAGLCWALELGNPSELCVPSKGQLEFTFKEHLTNGIYQRDSKVFYPEFRDRPRPISLHTEAVVVSVCSRKQLQLETLRPFDVHNMFIYTKTAVETARSVILLYKSTWLYKLCFCGIGVYDSVETRLVYLQRNDCTHVEDRLCKHTFLLLAILLAELALGAPIQLHLAPISSDLPEAPPEFEIPHTHLMPGYQNPMDWSKLSELLNARMRNPAQFVSRDYLAAVDFCYTLSQKLTTREEFLFDDLDECIKQIETP